MSHLEPETPFGDSPVANGGAIGGRALHIVSGRDDTAVLTTLVIPCFFCALSPATHAIQHSLLGERMACNDCDPNPRTSAVAADTLERMTGAIVAGIQVGAIDAGDERTAFHHLKDAFSAEAIDLYLERAIEAARRQLQRTASRFHPFFDRVVEAAAFFIMLVGLTGLYVVTNPPAENHRHNHFAQVRR